MPVEVGEFAVGGFVAIFVGVAILAGVWFARSRGHLRARGIFHKFQHRSAQAAR